MLIYLLEYVKPYERFAFSSIEKAIDDGFTAIIMPEKAKEHFIQAVLADCHNAYDYTELKLMKIFTGKTFEEHVNSYNAAQFNERFSEIATIAILQLIE